MRTERMIRDAAALTRSLGQEQAAAALEWALGEKQDVASGGQMPPVAASSDDVLNIRLRELEQVIDAHKHTIEAQRVGLQQKQEQIDSLVAKVRANA